jgi:hypothetical protein
MKSLFLVGLLVLIIGFSTFSIAQIPATAQAVNTAPLQERTETATPESAPTQLSVPIVADYPNQILSLKVEGADPTNFPATTASRIFAETVHGLTREVNPSRPVAVRLNLLVMIGGNRNYLEQVYGASYDAVITLSKWNDTVFSRLLVRAVRSSILTEQQLDEVAHTAVLRAHTRVDVAELKTR